MNHRKPRVLFVSSWYPSRVHDTLGNFVQKHAEAAALFAEVAVLYVCFDARLKDRKTEMISEIINGIPTLYFYCRKTANPLVKFLRYLRAYRKGLKQVRKTFFIPDVIHANVLFPLGLVFYFLKSFRKFPFVFTEHFVGYLPEYNEKPGFWEHFINKWVVKKAAMVLPVTLNLQQAMVNAGLKGNYRVIQNVVDTALFKPQPHSANPVKKIIHISSLDDRQKNVSGIIKTVAELYQQRQDFELHIVSDGDDTALKQLTDDLQLTGRVVFFHGKKCTAEVASMLQQSDFLVLFSHYENMPCVIIEAFACGVPVIATDVGGIREHLFPAFGKLIEAGNNHALLNAISEMLDSCNTYNRQLLHDYAEKNFSYESVGKQLYEIYSSIIRHSVQKN